jgi:hypothetical protein
MLTMNTTRGEKLDSRVAITAERMLRRLSRREVLRAGVVGGVAGLAALSLGQRPAFAATCHNPRNQVTKCSHCASSGRDALCCGPTRRCSHYGKTCRPFGCPRGYILCKQTGPCGTPPLRGGVGGGHMNRDHKWCEWCDGHWVACNGLGRFGNGYFICYDCVASSRASSCENWCTCLSECVCCNCMTGQDVRAEQQRIQGLMATN